MSLSHLTLAFYQRERKRIIVASLKTRWRRRLNPQRSGRFARGCNGAAERAISICSCMSSGAASIQLVFGNVAEAAVAGGDFGELFRARETRASRGAVERATETFVTANSHESSLIFCVFCASLRLPQFPILSFLFRVFRLFCGLRIVSGLFAIFRRLTPPALERFHPRSALSSSSFRHHPFALPPLNLWRGGWSRRWRRAVEVRAAALPLWPRGKA